MAVGRRADDPGPGGAEAALPASIAALFTTATPEAWLDQACVNLDTLLVDHANCELKAASTALGFIYRYPERTALCRRMSTLAREELRHFEQVRAVMEARGVPFRRLSASRYAGALRDAVRPDEPSRLLDMLLVGALIEARSCERFAALAPRLPPDVGRFYSGLLASEARHFENYLAFARSETGIDETAMNARFDELRQLEATLIAAPDPEFRFHSGIPAATPVS